MCDSIPQMVCLNTIVDTRNYAMKPDDTGSQPGGSVEAFPGVHETSKFPISMTA